MYGQFFLTLNTVFWCQLLTQFNSATRLLLKNMYYFNVMYKFYNYGVSSPFLFEKICRIIDAHPQKFVIFLKMLVVFAAIFFYKQTYVFFYKRHFISKAKIGKKSTNAKQHLEAEILLFQIYSHS